jgi:predicted alpha/beta-hydrolase family hydrolase
MSWRVQVDSDVITAEHDSAGSSTVFICAHGAGGHMSDRGMLAVANVMRAQGMDVVRFNFPYREKRSSRPDAMPLLKTTIEAVVGRAREELAPSVLIIGGRSMGGRAASMLAADGFACDGLLLLAYPLHPAGKPDQLRDAHLPKISVPVLCLNGTRDSLCRRDLMESVLERAGANWTMHWLEGADHGFHVLKSSGRTDAEVLAEVGSVSGAWLTERVMRRSEEAMPQR